MTRPLPGGRGSKYGTDAVVVQSEGYDERSTRIPQGNGWIFSAFGHPVEVVSSITMTANRLVFAPADTSSREFDLYEARIAVDTAVAGSTFRTAVYRYDGLTKGLIKVSGTEAVLSGATAGQQSVLLRKKVAVASELRYFIGAACSSAALGLLGQVMPTGSVVSPSYVASSATTELPDTFSLGQLTKGACIPVPVVVYLSQEATEVM